MSLLMNLWKCLCLFTVRTSGKAGKHWNSFGACCTSDVDDVPFAKAVDIKVRCVQ